MSLAKVGFSKPRLFVDSSNVDTIEYLGLPTVRRESNIRPMGHWLLSLWELFIRNPKADRYALFQDDILCCANLKAYLEQWYPPCGYLNLITWPKNVDDSASQGWYKALQPGKGGQGLVFDRETVEILLVQKRLVKKFQERLNSHQALDGAVYEAMKNAGYSEWVHNPSLLYHTGAKGKTSIKGDHRKQPLITSFLGENFNPLTIPRRSQK
jgi:hypothetical protein